MNFQVRVSSRLRIDCVEQRVFCPLKALIDRVTKRLQCGKVHLESAPVCLLVEQNGPPLGNLLQERIA